MMGREYGAEDRIEETVDFPVAIEPVRPKRSILVGCWEYEKEFSHSYSILSWYDVR